MDCSLSCLRWSLHLYGDSLFWVVSGSDASLCLSFSDLFLLPFLKTFFSARGRDLRAMLIQFVDKLGPRRARGGILVKMPGYLGHGFGA